MMPNQGEPRDDISWRKSRIAARILLREEAGRLTPRLIQQAIHGLKGRKYQLELSRRKTA
jgi:hypothetical protein